MIDDIKPVGLCLWCKRCEQLRVIHPGDTPTSPAYCCACGAFATTNSDGLLECDPSVGERT